MSAPPAQPPEQSCGCSHESLPIAEPGIIVLDNGLSGRRTGLDAAPRLKELVPHAKLFMFTAHADLKARADNEPAIDGFVLKTESNQLLALARLADQRLLHIQARHALSP
jgi:DNA-binding NarL/FixJ family response regulator